MNRNEDTANLSTDTTSAVVEPGDGADDTARLAAARERARAGNLERGRAKLDAQGKLFVRDRIDLLCDPGTFIEDALLANASARDLPADGVVTGIGDVDGRPVVVVANDPTVKAGSWGARTVEKIVRATEAALSQELPIAWLVDSAGARITDQVQLFPGAAAPDASSTIRSSSPAGSPRPVPCLAPRPPAAPTFRRSATW